MESNAFSPAIEVRASHLPSWMSVRLNSQKLSEFVVVDIETNGLEHREDHILSIGAVRFVSGKPVASFYSLSRPEIEPGETYTTDESTAINKITESLVEGAPAEKEVMEAFAKFVGTSVTVGHNIVRFDSRFIEKALKRHKINSAFGWMMFDTFVIARSFKTFEKNSLEIVCRTLGIKNKSAHHALSDCFATGEVFLSFLDSRYKKTIDSVFVTNAQPKAKQMDKSPLQNQSLNGEKIVVVGWSELVSRLEIAQSIIDSGGTYLHDTLAGTSKVLRGDIDKEDIVIRKSSSFGSASGKLRRAHELNERDDKNVNFELQDAFVGIVTSPHTKKILEVEVNFSTSEDVVHTVTGEQSLAPLWSEWDQHVKMLPKVKTRPTQTLPVRTQRPSPQNSRNTSQSPLGFIQYTTSIHRPDESQTHSIKKSYVTVIMLSLFLGILGADRLYLGHIKLGIAKLLLCWTTFGIWWAVDLLLVSFKKVDSSEFDWIA